MWCVGPIDADRLGATPPDDFFSGERALIARSLKAAPKFGHQTGCALILRHRSCGMGSRYAWKQARHESLANTACLKKPGAHIREHQRGVDYEFVVTAMPSQSMPVNPGTAAELSALRSRGFTCDRAESVSGFGCVAAPIGDVGPAAEPMLRSRCAAPWSGWRSTAQRTRKASNRCRCRPTSRAGAQERPPSRPAAKRRDVCRNVSTDRDSALQRALRRSTIDPGNLAQVKRLSGLTVRK
jgi:hypothetical protein